MVHVPERLFIIRGELKNNVVGITADTWHGSPVTRVFFRTSHGTKSWNYSVGDVHELPYRDCKEGSFRFRDQKGRFAIGVRVHYYGDGKAICVESKSGYLSYGFVKDLKLESSLLDSPFKNVFEYLCLVSEISQIETEKGEIISLRDRYNAVRSIFSNSLLYSFCRPDTFNTGRLKQTPLLLFPFGCNESQFNAVSNALSGKLSVIKGPPGTGKTQTILNIIANMLINEKACLVVSNNNPAVENVVEKLSRPEYGLGWLVAVLGSKDNRESFLANQDGKYPDLSGWKLPDKRGMSELRKRLSENTNGIPSYFKALERIALLSERLSSILHQKDIMGNQTGTAPKLFGIARLSSNAVFSLLVEMDADMKSKGKLSLQSKLKAAAYGFGWTDPDRAAIEAAAWNIQSEEIDKEISLLKRKTEAFKPLYDSLVEDSKNYLQAVIKKRYSSGGERRIFTAEDIAFRDAQSFLREYPIITSTTFSSTSCIDPAIPFDCLIMDEASQVDIASGALALNTSVSAVIVGDPKQLPNVVERKDAIYADEVFAKSGLPEAYKYTQNSFLDSLLQLFSSVPVTLLREHYRCAPDIIGFCNQQFYDGQLIVMKKRNEGPSPISVIRTVKGNHARGHQNEREAEEVVEQTKELEKIFKDIGVITPFREQAQLIRSKLSEGQRQGIQVDTVHKFQGREKDVILLSTTSNEATSFVDDPQLLNVAV